MRSLLRRIHASPLGGSPAVLAGLVVWNAGNYAFFLLAGRSIGPEDYGTVAALLAATLIVLVPSGALQVAFSRRTAELGSAGRGVADALLRRGLRASLAAGAALAVAAFVGAMLATSVSTGALALTALAIVPMGAFSIALGALQGRHRFSAFAGGLAMLGAPRPIAFALLALGVSGVVAATGATAVTLGAATLLVVALAWPREHAGAAASAVEWTSFRRRLVPLAAGLSGVAVLLNVDVIVARASLPDRTAGHFGAVAVLAKAVTLVPQTVSWVLLPRIARSQSERESTGSLLALAAVVTVAAGAVISLVCLAAGRQIVELAFGADYADGGSLLAPLVAAASLTGLLMVLMNHQMGRGVDGFVWVMAALAVIEIAVFAVVHGSAATIIWVEVCVGIAALVVYEVLYGAGDGGLLRSLRVAARAGQGAWRASTK